MSGNGAPEEDGRGDEGDQAFAALNTDLMMDARARESRDLQQVSDALKRIDSGVYGTCEECSSAIPMARLEALPFAEYCITCQEVLEREGALSQARSEFRLD
jgi:DnaK suppressor protein